ncbi:hypothetical protein CYY_001771 [Polysphondylium violaceum]|uniref:MRH domain-containing protein n=1 Tax=Polysphondylium violaceum TaxID=133409 RepID=A0A8J4V3M4_9MYCE|nr:hypothetical protein CYY_001771 [Polysphondylium violaceum]
MFKLSVTLSFVSLFVLYIYAQTSPDTCFFNSGKNYFDLSTFTNRSFFLFLGGSGTFYFNVCGPNVQCTQQLGYEVSACENPLADVNSYIDLGVLSKGTFSLLNETGSTGVVLSTPSLQKCPQGSGNITSNIVLLCKAGAYPQALYAQVTNPCLYELFLIGNDACPQ